MIRKRITRISEFYEQIQMINDQLQGDIDMVCGVLLRNYKNYNNINFIPICNNDEYKFTAYIGNNGVGKSAVLESIDVFLNDRAWNITHGSKGTEAYICPMFLIAKDRIDKTDKNVTLLENISDYLWKANPNINANFKSTPELKKWLDFKDNLKAKYRDTHYLILIGARYAASKDAYFATLDEDLKKYLKEKIRYEDSDEADKQLSEQLSEFMQYIKNLYSYIYIPVEASPHELLQLQNHTMQKLLNKDLLDEIEKILNKASKGNPSIVNQINDSLNSFMEDVNNVINQVEKDYEFTNAQGYKKNLRAKDIREKILEAYFPLRALKANGLPVSQLSSGEQRKAIIDIAYSILVSNGEKKTDRDIILGIDEPESSMHISNCFKHFQMLERLARVYSKQIVITTHWYGFLPVAQNGNLHYIENDRKGKRDISTFSLFNIMEEQRNFPDAIELKSMFDLATSIITYMRADKETSWIICEGSDDKLYLECILDGLEKINILPMGGCGNVIKLYRIIFSSLTDRNEEKDGNVLFIIDTDKRQAPSAEIIKFSGKNANINLRRLQIESGVPKLLDPNSKETYEQTEIEDCLLPQIYFQALKNVIYTSGQSEIWEIINDFEVKEQATNSMLRNDGTCLKAKSVEAMNEKQKIIDFAENDENKKSIAREYCKLYKEQTQTQNIVHSLRNEITKLLKISEG